MFSLGLVKYLAVKGFPGGASGKESACQWRRHRRCKRRGSDPWVMKKRMEREWLPTPVFLPGEFHGQRSRAGYSPWGRKESDTTEHACVHARACTYTHGS